MVLKRASTLLWLVFFCAAAQASPAAETLFTKAEAELQSGVGPRYKALRAQLDEYPLAIYLDYQALRQQLYGLYHGFEAS